jgi:hypothetical protein
MPYCGGKATALIPPRGGMLIFRIIYNDLRGIGLPAGLILRRRPDARRDLALIRWITRCDPPYKDVFMDVRKSLGSTGDVYKAKCPKSPCH